LTSIVTAGWLDSASTSFCVRYENANSTATMITGTIVYRISSLTKYCVWLGRSSLRRR